MEKEVRRAVARHKFKRWKIGFIVFFGIYLLCFIIGSILFKEGVFDFLIPTMSRTLLSFDKGFSIAFTTLLFPLIPVFLMFSAGITVYAPLVSFLSCALLGAGSGAFCSYLMSVGRVALVLFEIIFSSVVGYFTVIYATMTSLSALKIFTDVKSDAPELFSGSLFCASGFRGVFNFRYAATYIAFYVLLSATLTIITLIRTFAVTLF